MNYLEHSKEIITGIDPSMLGQCKVEVLVGHSRRYEFDQNTRVFSLGQIATNGVLIDAAIKCCRIPDRRILRELRDTLLIDDNAHRVLPMLPAFIGLVGVEGQDSPLGIITEDASRNGKVELRQADLSSGTVDELKKGFANLRGEVFDEELLIKHTTFAVAGRQRILDLNPSPFNPILAFYEVDYCQAIVDKAVAAIKDLTITVEADSELVRSLS